MKHIQLALQYTMIMLISMSGRDGQ